jgi:Fur family ferric uptake transcriptional regulator
VAEHRGQMDLFRHFLAAQGLKFTSQRRAIAEVFFEASEHYSLTELLDLAKRRQPSIGYATVYRTMKLMAESGLAAAHKFVEGHEARYEPAVAGEHHDHLICVRCSRIIEFEDEEIERRQDVIARQYGFDVTSHRHEIYGICPQCRASG